MHYSGTDVSVGATEDTILGSVNINFADPLSQNSANVFFTKDETNVSIAGAGYSNSQYLLNYSAVAYGVIDKAQRKNVRDYGVMLNATLPFYEAGYYYSALQSSFFQDYDTLQREPLSLSLVLNRAESYGLSAYANSLQRVELYAVNERSDTIVGGSFSLKHDLPYEFYVGVGAKYSRTNSVTGLEDRGVKLSVTAVDSSLDPSSIDIPSLDISLYAKDAGYAEVSLAKVLNFSAYFFTFPISLQRESIYSKYRYYEVHDFANIAYRANELTLGLTLSTVYFNSFELPISIEYLYNDSEFILNESKFRFLLGSTF